MQDLRLKYQLGQFIQRALNSVSSTFKVQSELELCGEIMQAAKMVALLAQNWARLCAWMAESCLLLILLESTVRNLQVALMGQ